MEAIDTYLSQIRSHLHLDPGTELKILRELKSHFDERVAELHDSGLPLQDSARQAIRFSGKPQSVARLFYEAHSQGSWLDALLVVQPHLLTAALFATHLWSHPVAILAAFALVFAVSLYGWTHGRPSWLAPWIGYSYSPFVATIFFSRDFVYDSAAELILGCRLSTAHLGLLFFVVLYVGFLWLAVASVVRVVRRDWLLVSLMLLPLPILSVWISDISRVGAHFYTTDPSAFRWDQTMTAVFLALGLAAAAFMRIPRRTIRVALVAAAGIGTTIAAGNGLLHDSQFLTLPLLGALSLFTFLAPAALEWVLGHGEPTRDPPAP